MYIGKVMESFCLLSRNAANQHISMTGISGCGKTSRLNLIELDAVRNGNTVIIFDINKSHASEMIFPPIKNMYEYYVNRIDAKADGLGINFLQPMYEENEQREDFVSFVSSIAYAMGMPYKMGSQQIGVLREAVIFALRHASEFPDEMTAISKGILQQEGSVAKGVYQKLWTLIHSNIFRESNCRLKMKALNIISFHGIDRMTQAVFIEILLSYLLRFVQFHTGVGKIIFVVDEYQNLMLGEGSVLRNILREGRKFGISLLLATQTLNIFPKDTLSILNQAATHLYFRPAVNEIKEVAKEIDLGNITKWMQTLSSLQVGEAVAVGNFYLNNKEISHPIVTQ